MTRSLGSVRTVAAALVVFAAAGRVSSPARAAEANPECVSSAADEMAFCKAVCQANFKTSKDLCRNIDHDCAETCREGHEGCLDGPQGPMTQLEACRLGCVDDLETAVTNCRETTTPDTPERDACVDAAQTLAFQCRDTCREGATDGLQNCRALFKECIRACPPAQN